MRLALINPVPGTHVINNVATFRGLEWIFQNIVVSILSLAGIALFIMLLVGGFKYMTSGGNPENAAAAQKTITYAIVGIIIIALAYLILVFISTFTGADTTNFSVYR
jgi:TRAP-type C4-dicarboxylate transport system permease small subunit